jgi:histidinol dehydrogenase
LADKVNVALFWQLNKLSRKEIAKKSIDNYGTIVLCDNLDEAVALSNKIAPEHLELCVTYHDDLLKNIRNAGSVFIGNYSPEPLGDYYAAFFLWTRGRHLHEAH